MRHRLRRTAALAFALCGLAAHPVHAGEVAHQGVAIPYSQPRPERPALRLFVFEPVADPAHPAHPAHPASGVQRAGILLFHGGGWNQGGPEWSFGPAQRFAQLGLVAFAVEYRLSDGAGTTPVEALADACAAFRHVRRHATRWRLDPQRLAGYGNSAGGHLVAAAATSGCPGEAGPSVGAAPNALLLWSAALDVADMFWFRRQLGDRAGEAPRWSPSANIGPHTPPAVIVHGREDRITPFAGADRFCRALRAQGRECRLHAYARLGHLLSRKLEEQNRSFDVDPTAEADGQLHMERFLIDLGYARSGAGASAD